MGDGGEDMPIEGNHGLGKGMLFRIISRVRNKPHFAAHGLATPLDGEFGQVVEKRIEERRHVYIFVCFYFSISLLNREFDVRVKSAHVELDARANHGPTIPLRVRHTN